MTELEQLKLAMRANDEKIQNEFIDSIADRVEFLLEKANRKGYEPTDHEREQFRKIATIITNMQSWF